LWLSATCMSHACSVVPVPRAARQGHGRGAAGANGLDAGLLHPPLLPRYLPWSALS
jgi:hypothetical protein